MLLELAPALVGEDDAGARPEHVEHAGRLVGRDPAVALQALLEGIRSNSRSSRVSRKSQEQPGNSIEKPASCLGQGAYSERGNIMDQIQRRLTGSARKSANHDRPLESVGVTGRVNERLVGCWLATYRFTWPPLPIRMRVNSVTGG